MAELSTIAAQGWAKAEKSSGIRTIIPPSLRSPAISLEAKTQGVDLQIREKEAPATIAAEKREKFITLD